MREEADESAAPETGSRREEPASVGQVARRPWQGGVPLWTRLPQRSREAEGLPRVGRGGGEGAVRRAAARMPQPVVVGRARGEPGEPGVVVDGRRTADGARLDRHRAAVGPRGAVVEDRPADVARGAPGDDHLGGRVGTEGEVGAGRRYGGVPRLDPHQRAGHHGALGEGAPGDRSAQRLVDVGHGHERGATGVEVAERCLHAAEPASRDRAGGVQQVDAR